MVCCNEEHWHHLTNTFLIGFCCNMDDTAYECALRRGMACRVFSHGSWNAGSGRDLPKGVSRVGRDWRRASQKTVCQMVVQWNYRVRYISGLPLLVAVGAPAFEMTPPNFARIDRNFPEGESRLERHGPCCPALSRMDSRRVAGFTCGAFVRIRFS
jgi:hypothetical protein